MRGVCWSTNETPTITNNKTEDGADAGNFTSNIIGLELGTTYYIRAYATNSEGTSYGNEISFTTLDLPTLTTSEVTEITQTTAISGGNITDDGGAQVTARGVCWSKGETPTINDSKTEDGTNTGHFISNITDLELNTTYHVRAYATNNEGTAYGNKMSFTTKDIGPDSFLDTRDNNIYKFVTIGNQVWMAENLKYLPSVVGPKTGSRTTPYYYVYDYHGTVVTDAKATANYNTYGVLYNWTAAMTNTTNSPTNSTGVQGVCPTGWHLPSDSEWTKLINYLGGEEIAGGKLKESGTKHWNSPNLGATNESEFTALPGGNCDITLFPPNIRNFSFWWSSSNINEDFAKYRYIGYSDTGVFRGNSIKEYGFSVRCVRD